MTACAHPFCWIYEAVLLEQIPAYMVSHYREAHPEIAERLERPAAEALR